MTTRAWSETTPLDSAHAGEGAEELRKARVDISERLLHLCPVGAILKWSSRVVPVGWKECDGSSLSQTDYAELYAVIGKTYGGTSTKFNLPDYQDWFTRGWNHSAASGLYDPDSATRTKSTATGSTMTAGDHVGTEQTSQYRSHYHQYIMANAFARVNAVYSGSNGSGTKLTRTSGYYPTTTYTETYPKNKRVIYMMRVEGINAVYDTASAKYLHEYINTWNNLVPADTDPMGDGAQEIRNFKVDIKERLDVMFPVGSIALWPTNIPPDGWLECNGSSSVSRTTYPELFNVITNVWGTYTSTAFTIPDLRGYFMRGAKAPNYVSTTEASRLYSHTHTYTNCAETGVNNVPTASPTSYVALVYSSTTSASNMGYYPDYYSETKPKSIYLMVIIKAKECE